jgi:hypothetical protein
MQLLQQPLVIVSAYKDKRKQELLLLLLLKLTHRKIAGGLLQSQRPSHGKQLTPTFQTFKAHDLFSHPTAV